MKSVSLTWSQVSAFRLARHHLADRKQADLTAVYRDVCGIQAQVMSAAEMALWARMHRLTRAEIHAALWKSRTLVKTSCMRQTLHLIPVADFSVYISALKRSRMAALVRIMSRFGVTLREVEAMNEAAVEALRGGPMPQHELTEHIRPKVGKRVRAWMEKVWSVFRPAIMEGLICYGPDRGPEVTLVRVDQWLPRQRKVSENEAKQIVLRRYLGAYGPATPQDFSKWSGISMGETRAVWESLEKELVEVLVENKKASLLRKDLAALRNCDPGEPVLRLLPNFDPFLLAHAEKNHLVHDRHYKRVYRQAGWISPVVLLNGRVIGTWSSAQKPSSGEKCQRPGRLEARNRPNKSAKLLNEPRCDPRAAMSI